MELKKSQDVWFCAFLLAQGHSIQRYQIIGRGKVCCYFKLTDEEWQSLKLLFQADPISKYKSLIEQIKDLAF